MGDECGELDVVVVAKRQKYLKVPLDANHDEDYILFTKVRLNGALQSCTSGVCSLTYNNTMIKRQVCLFGGKTHSLAHLLTPMIALSSVIVTCLALSTAAATCC